MKIIKTLLFLQAAVFLLAFRAAAAADEPSALESVRYTVEAVLGVMKDEALSAPEKADERREMIGSLVGERFDFREMSKRALARHWKELSIEQQNEFVGLFATMLQNTYMHRIEEYTDEKVTYEKEIIRGKGRYGIVQTTIISKDLKIPIDYRLRRSGGQWRVYDVLVEGVSIISNYRSQYRRFLSRESFADLIQLMKEKLEKA